MQCRRGLLLLPEALVGCSDSECRRDCCSEVEEISAACSDFCSDAGEICKVGDSCSNAVLEFGGRKSSGVFSGRLRLAREQQPAVETKAVTVLPLGSDISSRKCCSRLQQMATAEGRRRRHERDGWTPEKRACSRQTALIP